MAALLRDVERSGGKDRWSHLRSHGHSFATVRSAVFRECLIANGYDYEMTDYGRAFLTWWRLVDDDVKNGKN
jgi:hypothetical protein